ncbi:unnamed protein product [Notodromas monacha]|uniref:Peptidase S1 domain-containing protein n=1 Tax=Notodromas monacha TaxID=399045 RepID=A0A7R9BV02_9CRUS|nr:unnamed protein product [Notodromas monacha]CAG0920893.1 unnamed protein product [Notodromas monacha]
MKGRVLVIFFSIHFLSTGICSASADGSDIYVRPVRDFSRLEGGTAETNVNNTGYIAVIELRMNDTSVKPLLGAIISKRNILTTANYLDQAVWASQGLSISTIEVTLKATSGSPTKITNLAMTNVIKHPKYVSPNAATSEDDFLQYQPAILTLSSDAVLGISDDLRAIPISCSPTDTKLGDTVTVLDWSKPSSTIELQKATYSRKACPSGNPSLTKEWSLCFQLPTASSYSVSDMGKIGSPIVLNYGNNADVSLIAVKAKTYAVSANESLTAASSMSYSEIYSFVCQYADLCINNASAVTTPATTAAPASATTLAANATTNANATGTANNNATTTVPANNNATTTTVATNGTTTTKSTVTITNCRQRHNHTGECENQDEKNKWFGFMQLINIGIRYVFG